MSNDIINSAAIDNALKLHEQCLRSLELILGDDLTGEDFEGFISSLATFTVLRLLFIDSIFFMDRLSTTRLIDTLPRSLT